MSGVVLVSACLLGLCTRYDGASKASSRVLKLAKTHVLLPVCPEQLGGLPTPRPPADLYGGDGFSVLAGEARVITRNGQDVTEAFLRGAEEVAKLARILGVRQALLKSRSPSCGLTPQMGVCAAKLSLLGLKLTEID
ncbi:MAG: DUF523 domain-containing protein [Thermodesulfobacteria bacterium]|nr:DUF523 domain-containing protein [Thermodesulfobacteriota bacterium]